MKKFLLVFLSLLMVFLLPSCKEESSDLVLRIYNWQDYIDEGDDETTSVLDDWVDYYYETYGVKVSYVYDTFETLESMMNNLKTGKCTYDIVCPSEYMIQKMMINDMIEPFDYEMTDDDGNLIFENRDNLSPYLTNFFKEKEYNGLTWDDYVVPYMWGTIGFIYNSEYFTAEEVSTWNILWETDIKATAKDSIRDTYVAGVMYVYQDELNELKHQLDLGNIDSESYRIQVGKIMNRCDDDTIAKIEDALIKMKQNVYGLEVDSGKNDIIEGNIFLNLAWSGDAVYSMSEAESSETNPVILNFEVPKEGSNVWFDGWVMPKGVTEAKQKLVLSFMNFLCEPEIAVRNMDYIGYTSAVVGDEIYDYIEECYCTEDGSGEDVDLTYLFGDTLSPEYYDDGKVIFNVAERGRQFDAQYPSYDVITRCGIMEDFGDQYEKVLAMWESVKIGNISTTVPIAILIIMVIMGIGISIWHYTNSPKYRKKHNK